jgi:ABC-type Mn2+/Zn2+ transport system permease subunit
MITRGILPFCIVSSIIGVTASFMGFYISYRFDLPTGPTDIALLSVILVLSYLAKMFFSMKRQCEGKIKLKENVS